jgi:hypothetical protein
MSAAPHLFGEIRQPEKDFILIPCHTSEKRGYIPMGLFPPNCVPNNSCLFMEGATLFHFGILSSAMHMAWARQVCGRLESRCRYSGQLVYNHFRWPETRPEQRRLVERKARMVLAARNHHLPPRGAATLAELYNPPTMPDDLLRAHTELDRVVETCYRRAPFRSDRERVQFLFSLHEQMIARLPPKHRTSAGGADILSED